MTAARWCRAGAAIAFAAVAGAAPAAAEPSAAQRSEQGRALAADGKCKEAIPLLESAHRENPDDFAAALADARCRLQQRRYAEARALLAELHQRAPQSGEVDLSLAIAAYHDEDIDAAREALARAQTTAADRAETHLYTGVLALRDRDSDAALRAFDRARELDAERAEPMASYYAGVARARRGDRAGAAADWGRVREIQPDGVWADRAEKALARVERAESARRWRIELTSGIEADDNVVLRGDDIALPEEITDESDERVMWRVKGSSELLRGRAGALGISGDYTGNAHRELDAFDVHYPTAALWWQRLLGERTGARVEYRIGHAWVDGDAFVTSHSLGPTLVHTWPRAGRTTARARAFGFSYRDEPTDFPDGIGAPGDPCPPTTPADEACGAPGVDESSRRDRTGIGYELFAGHRWSLPWWERAIELRPGLRFQQYFARGNEASHLRVEPGLAAGISLPYALTANAEVWYAYRPYQGATSLPAPGTARSGVQFQAIGRTRRDQVTRVGFGLERTFFGSVTAEARYSFLDNHSNLAISDYQRHIFGGYVTVRLGK